MFVWRYDMSICVRNYNALKVFSYCYHYIVQTTPGSGGLLTTLQMRVASSACPKRSAVSESLGVEWQCAATGQPLVCTVSAWDRPWRGDTLMSHPRCKRIPVHTTPAPQGMNCWSTV